MISQSKSATVSDWLLGKSETADGAVLDDVTEKIKDASAEIMEKQTLDQAREKLKKLFGDYDVLQLCQKIKGKLQRASFGLLKAVKSNSSVKSLEELYKNIPNKPIAFKALRKWVPTLVESSQEIFKVLKKLASSASQSGKEADEVLAVLIAQSLVQSEDLAKKITGKKDSSYGALRRELS